MVLIHAEGLSLREAAEEYHRRHPDQSTPHHGSIGRLLERLKTAGSIDDKKRSGRPRTATGDANELHGDDTDMRVQFCEWFLERRMHQPNFEADIYWSNEACFHFNGTVNRHNAVYWATENPHIAVEAHNQFDPR
ncbi:hypothetical protein ANN_27305 [Periplaneta americana]|uniref:DUF4817 domain-containing protein n=1 Tax=Periplaneta americana TaxID=6978 RepID=A0ABQ8RXN5_PERAM|nr:hypothetical protein ANN_27305 [Periplaneta americana]